MGMNGSELSLSREISEWHQLVNKARSPDYALLSGHSQGLYPVTVRQVRVVNRKSLSIPPVSSLWPPLHELLLVLLLHTACTS